MLVGEGGGVIVEELMGFEGLSNIGGLTFGGLVFSVCCELVIRVMCLLCSSDTL